MMKSNNIKSGILVLLMMGGLFSTNAFATDGYFSLGYGAWSKGMAGVSASMYQMSLINGNPAGSVFLGKKFHVGLSFFNPNRQYTITGNPSGFPGTFGLVPGTIESESTLFFIPNIGANWVFGAGNANAIGVSIYGNGGMNTDYPTQTFYDQSETSTGVNIAQLFMNLTYSRKLSEKHAVGVTAVGALQLFEAKGLAAFGGFSSNGTKVSNNGSDNAMGFGFKVGYMGEIATGLHLGVNYQSKISMAEFDEYAGLFAEQGDFDIPSTWTAGLSYDISDKFLLAFDVKQILYSDVKSIANPMDTRNNSPVDGTGMPNPNFQALGTAGGWGFGWEDMTIFKVGIQFMANEDWTFRGGFSHGNNPIPESEVLFNILAPGIIENHIAFGFSKAMGDNQLDFSFNYALNNSVKGVNPLDIDGATGMPGNQFIEIEMNQIDVEIGYSF